MMLLRTRHEELDKFRRYDAAFNISWLLFFGTCPPGIHPSGVFFTDAERHALAYGLSPPAEAAEVEPYDGNIHNDRGLGRMHGS